MPLKHCGDLRGLRSGRELLATLVEEVSRPAAVCGRR
jgi:hypothetical protein